jgi:sucrose synthase
LPHRELTTLFETHRESLYLFFRQLEALERPFLLWPELVEAGERFATSEAGRPLAETGFVDLVRHTQEAVVTAPIVHLAVRRRVARWRYLKVHTEEMQCREISVSEFLAAKERLVSDGREDAYALELDLSPFERGAPRLTEARSIGRGLSYLNRHLSSDLFSNRDEGLARLLDFLKLHQVGGRPVMLNGGVQDVAELRHALRRALEHLDEGGEEESGEGLGRELRTLGFEPGWGDTSARIRESMALLSDILEGPSPDALEAFLARIPMIFSIVILSPHGYFGQANVLGKPDTGGQVVYILDQVRALEREMRASIAHQGLAIKPRIVVLTRLIPEARDVGCDVRREPILGTENSVILRVPFRDAAGGVIPEWISRFRIWPHLEEFAREAEREVLAELGARPDLVIGNYSDGNLVASLMARELGVTHCTIAHALEKTKYPLSDLNWREHEAHNHFSCQYTADLLAMNSADFIVTSTYQEIAGTRESVGQYESYQSFTMPGLYRVLSGVDCFDPRFNIVSPGADPFVFFPYHEVHRRPGELRREVRDMVFGEPDVPHRGAFDQPERPLLFAMSRLDRIKNMAGLVSWYGAHDALRETANLLLVGGHLDPADSLDDDERRQIEEMHRLLDEHGLDGQVRWLEMQTDKNRVGELYRLVADTRGAFVQPALFEAFGLTVIEAMSSGLPVFATRFGGPLEIIEDGVSGFHVDPHQGAEAAGRMHAFLAEAVRDEGAWAAVSEAAIARVAERYNWPLHASTLLKLARVYGFWRYISDLERAETHRYLDMFYGLMYRPLAASVARGPRT